MVIDRNSSLWQYLTEGQRGLIETGELLLIEAKEHPKTLSDFSYIVFPFAKAYEGFLKQFFLEMKFITKYQYESNHFRVGKALNPHLQKQLRDNSVYLKIINSCGSEKLADILWDGWKRGRNLLFHYFPHNLKAITLDEAEAIINMLIRAMETALISCNVKKRNEKDY